MKRYSLAVLALAAALAVGEAGVTALAASGWAQENGSWVYYSSSGNRLTDAWRKGTDGYWRYLDSSGRMAVNAWVDNDEYYVDSNGIMLSGQWLQVANNEKISGRDYYYFGVSGKLAKEKWEKINNNWYHFDDAGVMETGWILDNMYYCDANGIMVTGWQKLDPPEGYDVNDRNSSNAPYYAADDGKYWYYFSSNGKKVVPGEISDDEISTKKINGKYYALDGSGAVRTGWVCKDGDASDNIADYRYVDEDGQVRVGWYSLEPPEYLRNNYEHDVEWFYFDKKGAPEVGPMKGAATTKDLKRINGNTYLFDDNGNPVYGIQKVFKDSSESSYTAYYFGTYEQSSMLKGKYKINVGGTVEQYYFGSNGGGYTGVYENYLYYMGKLQKAESGSKYEVFSIFSDNGNTCKNYVVNTSGRIVKNTTVRDSNGTKYKTNSSGILVKVDDEDEGGGTYSMPAEPEWDIYN